MLGDRTAEEPDIDMAPHENVLRLTGRHFPMKIPLCEGQKKAMKRCKVCYKKNIQSESRYTCDQCPSKPGLCVDHCFRMYHTKQKYWKYTIDCVQNIATEIVFAFFRCAVNKGLQFYTLHYQTHISSICPIWLW